MVVPICQNIELAIARLFSFLLVEGYGDGQAFLLLEGLFVSGYDIAGNIHLGVVVLERNGRIVVGEVVHDQDWNFRPLSLRLVYLVENFGRFVYLEVHLSGEVEGRLVKTLNR